MKLYLLLTLALVFISGAVAVPLCNTIIYQPSACQGVGTEGNQCCPTFNPGWIDPENPAGTVTLRQYCANFGGNGSNNRCVVCDNSLVCDTFVDDATNPCKCTKCSGGFYLSGSTCTECSSCDGEGTYPTGCTDGVSNTVCKDCDNKDVCSEYETAGSCACKTCKDGYQAVSGECVQCDNNCATYVTPGSCECDTCPAGFELVGGVCVKCTTNCASYVAGSCDCSECLAGYELDTGTNECTACTTDFYDLLNGQCLTDCGGDTPSGGCNDVPCEECFTCLSDGTCKPNSSDTCGANNNGQCSEGACTCSPACDACHKCVDGDCVVDPEAVGTTCGTNGLCNASGECQEFVDCAQITEANRPPGCNLKCGLITNPGGNVRAAHCMYKKGTTTYECCYDPRYCDCSKGASSSPKPKLMMRRQI